MKKGMCITYTVGKGLYVNVTNRCTNRCNFCIRNNGDGAYGSDSLWLEREPTVEEIIADILSRDLTKYDELVFCGYGEPTLRLEDIREVALAVKKRADIPVRLNTNGHADLIYGGDASPLLSGAFDTVSVSLNTPSAEKYVEICHPVYGAAAFAALVEFAKNANKYVQKVLFSVVKESLGEDELYLCQRIADEAGVELKVRNYIGP